MEEFTDPSLNDEVSLGGLVSRLEFDESGEEPRIQLPGSDLSAEEKVLGLVWQLVDRRVLPRTTFARVIDGRRVYLLDLPGIVVADAEASAPDRMVVLTPSGLHICRLCNLDGQTYPCLNERQSASPSQWADYAPSALEKLSNLVGSTWGL